MLMNQYIKHNCSECNGKPCADLANKIYVETNVEGAQYLNSVKCPIIEQATINKKAAELIYSANVPKMFRKVRATDYKVTRGNKNAVITAESCILDGSGIYIYGEAGLGKTMLASIIANERAYLGKKSYFATVPDLLDDLRDFNNSERREIQYNRVRKVPCLIIDDLGAENPTNWSADQLFGIINHRYNEQLQTIITSNFDFDDVIDRMPNYTGTRIVRRIKAICKPVQIT